MPRFAVPRLAAALALAGGLAFAHTAFAQTSAAPQSGSRTLSLGSGGAGGGPILSREELRDCLQRQDRIARQSTALDADRKALDAEREAIGAEQRTLAGERSQVESTRDSAASLNERYRELSARVEAWNVQTKAVQERSGPAGDRERRRLDRERMDIQKLQAQLDAEREQLSGGNQAAVERYNARAASLDGRVLDWNRRNDEIFKRSEQLVTDRDLWAGECANRRYREDDEILLKKGAK